MLSLSFAVLVFVRYFRFEIFMNHCVNLKVRKDVILFHLNEVKLLYSVDFSIDLINHCFSLLVQKTVFINYVFIGFDFLMLF
jgi:hypothetical protein